LNQTAIEWRHDQNNKEGGLIYYKYNFLKGHVKNLHDQLSPLLYELVIST